MLTYQNPVWPGYMADPFAFKWRGEYYAYGTGNSPPDEASKGRVFPLLHSRDLANWEYLGGALEPLAPIKRRRFFAYWAPEVAERDGTFYMYYSAAGTGVGNGHRLRVALADHPAGPFVDSGNLLLPDEEFSIDPHPFRDPKDGQWYLFFAKNFFDERVGTGTAVVPLADDMISVAGPITPVLRASSDWHIYGRKLRAYKKTWDAWHTVEGPFVVEQGGLYYCFYSGGAWRTANYGVSYGVAAHPLGPYRDEWSAQGPSVLRAIDEKVLGPGHNSVVAGPDDTTQFIIYHAWDAQKTARRMCIDPLVWTENGPRCLGPSVGPQAVPMKMSGQLVGV